MIKSMEISCKIFEAIKKIIIEKIKYINSYIKTKIGESEYDFKVNLIFIDNSKLTIKISTK